MYWFIGFCYICDDMDDVDGGFGGWGSGSGIVVEFGKLVVLY